MPYEVKRRSVIAIAVLVIGMLILVASSLCTGFFLIASLLQVLTSHLSNNDFEWTITALVVGGPLTLFGGLLVWISTRLNRN
jgi:hypothetical protein